MIINSNRFEPKTDWSPLIYVVQNLKPGFIFALAWLLDVFEILFIFFTCDLDYNFSLSLRLPFLQIFIVDFFKA